MAAIHPQRLFGNWVAGIALDVHTVSSTPIGPNEQGRMQFNTVRTEIAELLYRLKYLGDQTAAQDIIMTTAGFLRPRRARFDLIIPVPASNVRVVQPVLVLARGVGQLLECPIVECVTTTRPAIQLKNVTDPERRKELVRGLYAVERNHTAGKNVLLFDDLFRSGSTLNANADVLLQHGQAASVRVLTITRTRSNQ